jgi:F-type H+-transporting ATPase subunit delta
VTDRSDAYAAALLQVAKAEGRLDTVEDELFRFARILEGNDELRMKLSDPVIPLERREGIVDDLLNGKVTPITIALIQFVVAAGRGDDLPDIIDRLVEAAAEERLEVLAEVRSAVPLGEEQQRRLSAALGRATGKRVSVKVVVDPSVIGGVVARVGDTVFDGTVRHRLEQLREAI